MFSLLSSPSSSSSNVRPTPIVPNIPLNPFLKLNKNRCLDGARPAPRGRRLPFAPPPLRRRFVAQSRRRPPVRSAGRRPRTSESTVLLPHDAPGARTYGSAHSAGFSEAAMTTTTDSGAHMQDADDDKEPSSPSEPYFSGHHRFEPSSSHSLHNSRSRRDTERLDAPRRDRAWAAPSSRIRLPSRTSPRTRRQHGAP